MERCLVQILNLEECLGQIRSEFLNLKDCAIILIYSPFSDARGIKQFFNKREVKEALERGVRVLVITRPDNKEALNCLTEFHANKKYNLEVYTRKGFHEKVIIIDDVDKKITYIGSANFLSSSSSSSELIVRIDGKEVMDKILNKIGLPRDEERYISQLRLDKEHI